MIDDRERDAAPDGSSRSDPPSVPTRITLPDAAEPPRRGAVVPTMVPLARKRAHRTGLRPGGATATTEPMRDLVGAAARSGAGPARGPARASLGPPAAASPAATPQPVPAVPPAAAVPPTRLAAASPAPVPAAPVPAVSAEPVRRAGAPGGARGPRAHRTAAPPVPGGARGPGAGRRGARRAPRATRRPQRRRPRLGRRRPGVGGDVRGHGGGVLRRARPMAHGAAHPAAALDLAGHGPARSRWRCRPSWSW